MIPLGGFSTSRRRAPTVTSTSLTCPRQGEQRIANAPQDPSFVRKKDPVNQTSPAPVSPTSHPRGRIRRLGAVSQPGRKSEGAH